MMKWISLPLYQLVKKGVFVWGEAECTSWANLLYLVSMHLKNYIYKPERIMFILADTSVVETSEFCTQWNPTSLYCGSQVHIANRGTPQTKPRTPGSIRSVMRYDLKVTSCACLTPDDICIVLTSVQMHPNMKALRAEEALCTPEYQWFTSIRKDNLPKKYPSFPHKLERTARKVNLSPTQETGNILEQDFKIKGMKIANLLW